jgi:hypothetical protein
MANDPWSVVVGGLRRERDMDTSRGTGRNGAQRDMEYDGEVVARKHRVAVFIVHG